jgi:hypothetical protein
MIVASPGRVWIAGMVVFTALCVLVLLAPAESGAARRPAHVTVVATPTEGVGSDPANYDVTCPEGLKAVGGGFNTGGYVLPGPGGLVTAVVPVVMESRRLNARTWRVTERAAENPVVASSSSRGTTVSASVYCRPVKGPVTAVEGVGALSTDASSASSADPKCPKGTVALAGGWSVTAASGFAYPSVYESFRDGSRAWKSSAVPGSQPSVGLLGFAYCARARKPPRRREVTGSGRTIFARCKNNLTAAAGGFQATPGTFIQVSTGSTIRNKRQSYQPTTPYPAGPTWASGSGGLYAGATGFAYCS